MGIAAYFVFLPLAFLLARWLNWGAYGAWLGATIYIIVLSGVFFYRFYSEKWRHMNIFLPPAAEIRREELRPERENG